MKTDFKFSNLLGTVYRKGNLIFTPDGTCLLSPVGNRVTVFDLINNQSYTLPFAHRRNIACIDLTPRGNILLSVDEDGHAILADFRRRLALYHFSFKDAISVVKFSPSGRHFVVGLGRTVQIWHSPRTPTAESDGGPEFAPFILHRSYTGHHDTVQNITWSRDSRFLLSAGKDLTARIWSLEHEQGFVPVILAGHKESVLGAWYSGDHESIYTVSQDGALFVWKYGSKPDVMDDIDSTEPDTLPPQWRIKERHYFKQSNANVKSAAYHIQSNLLVAGFSNGIFGLYELPGFNMIHTLSMSRIDIDFVTINTSGEWLAFGASKFGQLLVWDWQSESYILKQQGHLDFINALTFSPDGQRIVTAGDDGKLKVWDLQSGFCVVTLTEHSSGVTACEFAKKGNVLFTSSLDGSIRAWDLIRYRNFRTFTGPSRLSFSSLAVDPSGEVVCAASLDSFEIHIWSVQTGQLLDRLAGHEGPISALAFAPFGGVVVSGSWDHTVRLWNIFSRSPSSEPLQLQADVLRVAVRPDGKQVAVSTLDGQLTFWSISEAGQEISVDGRRDISGGRKLTDRRSAANAAGTKAFTSLTYSTDGSCVIAGGNSKYICLYNVQSGVLIRKFVVSINLSIDGTQEFLNSRNLSEAGPLGLIDTQGEASDLEDRIDRTLPGSNRGPTKTSSKRHQAEVRVPALAFSPTGETFCAASTEGLLLYSTSHSTPIFSPLNLDITTTPSSALSALSSRNYILALSLAFHLNIPSLTLRIHTSIPPADIDLVVHRLPPQYIAPLLRTVLEASETSPHLEFNLRWLKAVLAVHGPRIKKVPKDFVPLLRRGAKVVAAWQGEVARMADDNGFLVGVLLGQPVGKGGGGGGEGIEGEDGRRRQEDRKALRENEGDMDFSYQ